MDNHEKNFQLTVTRYRLKQMVKALEAEEENDEYLRS